MGVKSFSLPMSRRGSNRAECLSTEHCRLCGAEQFHVTVFACQMMREAGSTMSPFGKNSAAAVSSWSIAHH